MNNALLQKSIPEGWALVPAGEIFTFVKSYVFSRDNLINNTHNKEGIGNIHYGDIHSTFSTSSIDLTKASVPMIKDAGFVPKPEDLLRDGDLIMADASEDYAGVGVTVSLHGLEDKKIVGGLHTFVLRDEKNKTDIYFRQYIFRNPEIRNKMQKIANGVSVYGISKTAVSKIVLPLPPLPEQKRIVAVLETWDKAIDLLEKKIELKEQLKKGLMQQLLTGKKRLPGFSGEWKKVEIGSLLNYEQPTKYLVKSKDYSDEYTVPVLTAGKTFLLGYTDEDEGIRTDLPVIIFDDFTTASQWVDFPFKVKSSAMKMLTAKSKVNLRFIYERMQLIAFPNAEHKRKYLSEYQYIAIAMPSVGEQSAISNVLSTASKEIKKLRNKVDQLKSQKTYFLNNLVTGKIRTPEDMKIAIFKSMMTQYKNISRNSGVIAYFIKTDYIVVQFEKRKPNKPTFYKYSYHKLSRQHVDEMKRLAQVGEGLCTYISKHRDVYDGSENQYWNEGDWL